MIFSQQEALQAIQPIKIPAFRDSHLCYGFDDTKLGRIARDLLGQKFDAAAKPTLYSDDPMRLGLNLHVTEGGQPILAVSYNNPATRELVTGMLGKPDYTFG